MKKATCGMVRDEPLIFERSKPGKRGFPLPELDVSGRDVAELLPKGYLRDDIAGFPEVSEVEVVRHFTRLSTWNYGVDTGLYPLGSCTMKYNPKVNEKVAREENFLLSHPYQPEELSQGNLELMYQLERFLNEITGMDRTTLQPAAGAHGELTGMLLIRAYLTSKGNPRKKVLIPDSAHGTNPASASIVGYQVVKVKSDERGCVDSAELDRLVDEDVAALMITNPNTLGLFEEEIVKIADIVHRKGALLYMDGANLNALLGKARPGDMGVDAIHLNLHKTFSTPHGGGGPGSGPVAVKEHLAPFLPVPLVEKGANGYYLNYDLPQSIGKVRTFYANFGVLIKAYAYILTMGAVGLEKVAERAVVAANYLRVKLRGVYHLPYDRICMHEVVFSDKNQEQYGVKTLDIAKRLLDYGFHPPTIYFPLIVPGALMIEPTDTETKEELDSFIEAMKEIAREAKEKPELLHSAPHITKVSRLDEVGAARNPILRWKKR